MPVYHFIPQDVLCFGGGQKPLTPWPSPSVVFDAWHAALHRAFPQVQLWEHTHAFGRNGSYPNRNERLQRFGSLRTAGPFPGRLQGGQSLWYFPAPAGVKMGLSEGNRIGDGDTVQMPPGANSSQVAGTDADYSLSRWWSKQAVESWLAGNPPGSTETVPASELFGEDAVVENAVDQPPLCSVPRVRVPYLRLCEEVVMACVASSDLPGDRSGRGLFDRLAQRSEFLFVGGRQRICRTKPQALSALEYFLPLSAPVTGSKVKWLLLSPAIFPPLSKNPSNPAIRAHSGGWLPNWICPETGRILLRKGTGERPQLNREEWRHQVRQLPPLDCRLVASVVPPLVDIRGWSEHKHLRMNQRDVEPGPKPVLRTVPAGAVYYFEGPDAPELARLLAWHGDQRENIQRIHHRRSTLLGEKGFGLGVSGPWESLADPQCSDILKPFNPPITL